MENVGHVHMTTETPSLQNEHILMLSDMGATEGSLCGDLMLLMLSMCLVILDH